MAVAGWVELGVFVMETVVRMNTFWSPPPLQRGSGHQQAHPSCQYKYKYKYVAMGYVVGGSRGCAANTPMMTPVGLAVDHRCE